jgi:solute carrier family 25 citrate transporter 1
LAKMPCDSVSTYVRSACETYTNFVSITLAVFFDQIKEQFASPETGTLTPLRNMLAGMTAGVAASITAVTPSERIKTALIDDARHEKRFRSGWHATTTIWKEGGIVGMYRGLAGNTLKQASATAFRMGTYNVLKDYQKKRDIKQSTVVNFANGCKWLVYGVGVNHGD